MRGTTERFDLRERIGGGVTTDVYRARDRELGHEIVVRISRSDVDDADHVERVLREAEAASDIRHPNVVRILDHGVIDGRPFVARELVEGATLDDVLARRGPLPQEEARALAQQIARGLEAAHARGVLHRDLNCGNVFVTPEGTAKIADFGMPGTPRHPAPEQADGQTIDERADVFGLGAVLYHMLTGKIPHGETAPRRLPRRVGGAIGAVVMRALESEPARRFQSAAAMADALNPTTTTRPRPVPLPPPTERVARPRPERARRRAAALPVWLVVLALVLAVLGGALVIARPDAPETAVLSATTTPRATSTPPPTMVPTPLTALVPPVETTPEPTAIPVVTPRPVVTPPPPPPAAVPPPQPPAALAPVPPSAAAATVRSFYELIAQKRYDEAAALWSPRMRANYPPSTNIYGRFDRTRQIVIRSITPIATNTGGAAVAIDILEVLDSGVTRRWVGEWFLVWDGARWLMDAPSLRPG